MKKEASNKIQGLWIGTELSNLEKLCINSFLKNGHSFYLYTYTDIAGIPEGTTICDANQIIPEKDIFRYTCNCGPGCKHTGSLGGFANLFRYKLLFEKGGYWVDLDMVCLRHFDFNEKYIFSSEMNFSYETGQDTEYINVGVIKAMYSKSKAIKYAYQYSKNKDPSKLNFGETGPKLFKKMVDSLGLQRFTKPYYAFCPVSWEHWKYLIDPDAYSRFKIPDLDNIPEGVYAIHMSNEMLRQYKIDKNGSFHPDSVYERLKKKYLC